MKKIILFLTLILVAQLATAQRTAYHSHPENLFNEGKEMFLAKNYVGAQDVLSKFVAESNDTFLKEEAAYMMAVSAFHRGLSQSGNLLKEFLDTYPASVHRHQTHFLIGSYHFDKKEWKLALYSFNQSHIDYLTLSEQEDYSFRKAYAHLQLGDKKEAENLFGLLSQNSHKYRDAGNFYGGYIEYTNGNYQKALQRFERLKSNGEYSEQVAFYTAQATFFDNQLDKAIQLAQTFVSTYPRSEHVGEMYRIMGNSNYRLGRTSNAILYYENYLAATQKPLRGDAYFLGLSYSENGKLNDAVAMFQQAIGKPDELTQNAQLQLGQTYLKLKQKQPAQMAFEAASRDNFNPKVRETAMFNYALLAHETNFSVFSESITLFENFLKEFPRSKYADQVNDILAETFLSTRDYRAALAAINRISRPGRSILEAKQMILFQLGSQQFINGNMNEAIQLFNQSIDLGDYDMKAKNNAYYWRGEAYYRIGNYSHATSDFQQFGRSASKSDENYAIGWYNLGYALLKQQQYNQSVRAFQQYIAEETNKNKPEYADAHNRLGDNFYFNRRFAEAEQYYNTATNLNPATADYAAYQRAFVMGLQRNYPGKINVLDELMRRYPHSQYVDDALYEKSRALTMLNRENEAILVLQKLVTDFPKTPLAGQGGIQLGQLYYNTGNYQRSISAYKSVITNFPASDVARTALISLETVYRDMNDIQSYVNYANSLPGGLRITPSRQDSLTYLAAESIYMRSEKANAETALQRYLQSYPNGAYYCEAHYYLGILADQKGDKRQALNYFRRVVDANCDKFFDDALLYTAQAEHEQGDNRQALADYTRLANSARKTTNQQKGQMGLARLQSEFGHYHEAERAATALLEYANLSPETAIEAHYIRGKAYQQLKETDKAMADFQFVANDTRSIYGAEAQFILADTYYRWKSYDKAEAQVKDFMKKGTPHQYWMARALIVLSDTYLAKGDTFQANQYLESLKSNYKGGEADIQQMINERLK